MFVLFVMLACCLAPATAAIPSAQSCLLPAFPANGSYTYGSGTRVPRPGDEVSRLSALEYSCSSGYFLTEDVSVCRGNNIWSSKPACKKQCTLYGSDTVEYSCFSEQILRIPCEPAMPHGSYVYFECKTGHTLSGTQTLDEIVCLDGSWSRETPDCEADCGVENAEVSTFITKADIAPKDSLPWHVAVYQGTEPAFTYICGGTIITSRLVIGAAHCFFDSVNRQAVSARFYRVAANKHYQAWRHQGELNTPYSEVREIRLHTSYTGDLHHEQNDLALVILETPFEFSNKVGAICWNLGNRRFDRTQLSAGSEGKFAGWGVTEDGKTAEELRVLRVPVIDREACRVEYQKYHSERYITADKICAGFLNGSTGCNGDSGAGLVFPSNRYDQKTWWLRGVLSIGPRDASTGQCRKNTYTAYTSVFALGDWLKQQINDLKSQRELFQVEASAISATSCLLPEFPANGRYASSGGAAAPGDEVNRLNVLQYYCSPGYFLSDQYSVCDGNNTWSAKPLCTKQCALYLSYTVDLTCFYKSQRVTCQAAMFHGASVHFNCTQGHSPWIQTLEEMTCRDGSWSREVPECKPDCGQDISEAIPLIAFGTVSRKGELPWNVVVYEKNSKGEFDHMCGGTIISSRLVVSVAHCYTDWFTEETKPSLYRVAANKHYREWNHPSDLSSPKAEVREIHLHEWFRGEAEINQNDLALLVLKTPFEFSNKVAAVCWDLLDERFDKEQLKSGNLGKIAAMGVTENGLTEELRVLRVPIIDRQACYADVHKHYYENYLTSDKICAGYVNDSAACFSDRGAGLVVPSTLHGKQVWWLRGVLSTVALTGSNRNYRCPMMYAAYTRVFALRDWLTQQINQISSRQEPFYNPAAVTDLLPIQPCLLPEFPANGRYASSGGAAAPGDEVNRLNVLQYYCSPGYFLSDQYSVCDGNNTWSAKPLCTKQCALYLSYTVDLTCFYKSQRVTCQAAMFHGASVHFNCTQGHSPWIQTLEEMTCRDGSWSREVPECKPDCGQDISEAIPLIAFGTVSRKGELPWNVVVYEKNSKGEFDHMCGGTIISSRLVVSVAHCYTDWFTEETKPSLYRVAANKHYREWNHPSDLSSPKAEVREIHLHEWFRGEAEINQNDLALLVLKTPFEFSNKVAAVCWDLLDERFDKEQLKSGNLGKIAAMGVTENGLTEELRVLRVPIIDRQACYADVHKHYYGNYLTSDKICAGYVNDSAACFSDRGAGLVVPSTLHGKQVWWLRGVLSTVALTGSNRNYRCPMMYAAYTRVFALRDWLTQQINQISSRQEPFYNPAAVTDLLPIQPCLLPEFPANGRYASSGGAAAPGDEVNRLNVLQYSCSPGYFLSDQYSVCDGNNTWSAKPLCTKQCALYLSYTVDLTCFYKSQRVTCQAAMFHGASVHFNCTQGHSPWIQTLEEMTCRDGSWSREVPECKPDCGQDISEAIPLIAFGTVSRKGELPWNVVVYEKNSKGEFDHMCGGTIISSRLVVSVAHCYTDWFTEETKPSLYRVAANKHYREWNHPSDLSSPKAEVREIHLHEWFRGEAEINQNDLALLVLKTPFEFSNKVAAVCWDLLDERFDKEQLKSGNLGKIAAMGVTENGLTEELRVLRVPIIDRQACYADVHKHYYGNYLTSDKICAGYVNDSAACFSDRGAGLVVPSTLHGKQVWWLRGVLSTVALTGSNRNYRCPMMYAAYTRVFALRDWLTQQINQISSRQEPFYNPAAVTDLLPIQPCLLPEFPANGRYASSGGAAAPGDEVNRLNVLQYYCSPGYFLSDQYSVCDGNNTWSAKPLCTKQCALYLSYTVDLTCFYKSQRVTCQAAMFHGASVHFNCTQGHSPWIQTLEEMTCRDGSWSREVPECKPDCGQDISEAIPLIAFGTVSRKGELPWNVVVYEKNSKGEFDHMCGGTIISSRLVVSVAHCYTDWFTEETKPSLYRVAANKHYREWNHPSDLSSPKAEVREIHLHEWFRGEAEINQNDLALLVLKTPFEFSNKVAAVCWDLLDERFDKEQLKSGNLGKIAAMGVTENGLTEELRVLRVPIIDRQACYADVHKHYYENYLTSDKICAGYVNDSAACFSDRGAGLVVPSTLHGKQVWWLRGVLSTVALTGSNRNYRCPMMYAAYTRVFALRDWLTQQINQISSRQEPFYNPAAVTDLLPIQPSKCILPAYPANGNFTVLSVNGILPPGTQVDELTLIKYSCTKNYHISTGNVHSTCEKGTWNTEPPVCRSAVPEAVTDVLQTQKSACTLPAYPINGNYTVEGVNGALPPGTQVEKSTVIKYFCAKNFDISTSNVYSTCEGGKWNTQPPVCRKRCEMINSPSVNFNCTTRRNQVIPCSSFLPYATLITPSCKPGHYNPAKKFLVMKCKRIGKWNQTAPECKPVVSSTTAPSSEIAEKSGCVLPNYPSNGGYIIRGMPNIRPGMMVDQNNYMSYSCNKGYDMSGIPFVLCEDANQWSPIPSCHKKCHMPTSYSVDFVCRSANNEIIECGDLVAHGTEVQSGCKRAFIQVYDQYLITCQDGLWTDHPPICRAICGLEKPVGVELIANGTTVTKNAFPWHVGVYQAHNGTMEYICGGTILYSNIIVSAGHCFYFRNGLIDARYFKVAVGKFFRSYDNAEDDAKHWVQKRDVAHIYLPNTYGGSESRYQSDIALVHLKTPLEFSGSVRPICFDLNDSGLNSYQLKPGTMEKVAGWGLTENGSLSEELRVLNMPIIDLDNCKIEMAKYKFIGFLTTDKLCAGYTTGTLTAVFAKLPQAKNALKRQSPFNFKEPSSAVCQGDSGGGLVFAEQSLSSENVWHLRALVSVAPFQTKLDTNQTTCHFNTYSAFTEVYKHRDWMIQLLKRLKLLTPS